jgi:hypothetical protein
MLEQVAAALDRGEYNIAAEMITPLLEEQPNNYQVQLYAARLLEETEQPDAALQLYQNILQQGINSKALAEARQGIARIAKQQERGREQVLQQVQAQGQERPETGVLILEPIPVEQKQAAAPKFGQIMNLDLYSARLQLPSRSWRLYRSGKMGELDFYQQQLQQAEIPSFCVSLADIKSVVVFQVNYMQLFDREVKIFCTDDRSKKFSFRFSWSEVTQVVTGLLPIFEEVLDGDSRNRTKRKPKVLDYVDMCDLQIGGRRTIFRLCAQTYEFKEHQQLAVANANNEMLTGDLSNYLNRNANTGILTGDLSGIVNCSDSDGMFDDDLRSGILTGDLSGIVNYPRSGGMFDDDIRSGILTGDLSNSLKTGILNKSMIPYTSHNNWQSLIAHIKREVPAAKDQNQFTPFADTALGYPELLQHIHPHIKLLRRADSHWDRVFQLYSALSLCQYEQLYQTHASAMQTQPDIENLTQQQSWRQDLYQPETGMEEYN